jgi:hypothetical protein
MKDEVAQLKAMKVELDELKSLQSLNDWQGTMDDGAGVPDTLQTLAYGHPGPKIDDLFRAANNTDNLSLVLSLTKLYVSSPLSSVYFIR